jgi:hypothetical protein
MIDDTFSKESFSTAGLDTPEARSLADQLAKEIQAVIHLTVVKEIDLIIKKLNQMGHNLRLYEDPTPGDISYRDDNDNNENYQCYLRIAIDTIISTGYSHLYKFNDAESDRQSP